MPTPETDTREVEIWIDVDCRGDGRHDRACTLFGRHRIPMRPQAGESLSFHQAKGSSFSFRVLSPIGAFLVENIVSVTVDEVGHYAVFDGGRIRYNTSLRCSAINVHSESDARQVRDFMISQLGFEVDSYAHNILED